MRLLHPWLRRLAPALALAALAVCLGSAVAPRVRADDAPVIAAAASLRYALDEIAARFQQETGQDVRLTYGATGSLVHQIENGAPFELLLAADEASVKRLAEKGRTEGAPSIFARGRISLVAPKGSPVAVDGELKGLGAALAAGKVQHFAIANPDTAPYGRAAREALQKAGLWSDVEPLLVLGENVGQAAQFATTGAAEAGIVAHSLVVAPDVAAKITAAQIPETWHQPINHGMALLKGAGPAARAFAAFVRNEESRAVLERNGFSVPTP
jgi:molybdate transport system substrate-binding protein